MAPLFESQSCGALTAPAPVTPRQRKRLPVGATLGKSQAKGLPVAAAPVKAQTKALPVAAAPFNSLAEAVLNRALSKNAASTSRSRQKPALAASRTTQHPKGQQKRSAARAKGWETGFACQSSAEHIKGHGGLKEDCQRCVWIKNKSLFQRLGHFSGAGSERTFIAERPAALGGEWGLGCWVCAAAHAAKRKLACGSPSAPKSSKLKRYEHTKRRARLGCKWALYKIKRIGSIDILRQSLYQHIPSRGHRLAVAALASASSVQGHLALAEGPFRAGGEFFAKPACSGDAASEFTMDEEIFAGKVPQIKDWVDAWADVSSSISFLKQERCAKKKGEYLKGRWRRMMLSIIAEAVRTATRKRLREATCITLSVDDSKRRKLIRFRCDPQHLLG